MHAKNPKNSLTIDQILAWRFAGNHFSDGERFDLISLFVLDDKQSVSDKARALRHMYVNGMGIHDWQGDKEEVEAALRESQD